MKRKIMISAVSFFVIMLLTGFMLDGRVSDDKESVSSLETAYTDHVGTWRLTYDNDRVLDETFPDIYAFGSELTIRPDGKLYWHIGAAGAAGTYEAYGNQLTACVSDIMEYDEYRIPLTVNDEGKLLMKYKSVPLEWTYVSGEYQ